MTPERLDEIRARTAAATDGPWVVYHPRTVHYIRNAEGLYVMEGTRYAVRDPADADFIAHARRDVPDLVEEVKRLRALLEGATR